MIVVGKILSLISPIATATAAILGVLTYIHTNNKNRREKEKAEVTQIRDSLKKLRDESHFFLTTIASEEDQEKYYPFISLSVEIASEIKRRLGTTTHKAAFNAEQMKEIVFSSIVIGWEKSPITVKVNMTIENIRKIRPSLPGQIAVIGETGDILASFIQHKFSPSLYFLSTSTVADILTQALEDQNSLEAEITKLPGQLLEEFLYNFEKDKFIKKFIKCLSNLINISTSVLLQLDDQQLLDMAQDSVYTTKKTKHASHLRAIHQLNIDFKQEDIDVVKCEKLLGLLKDKIPKK